MAERFALTQRNFSSLYRECGALLNAAVDVLEPFVTRITGARRWVAVEIAGDDFEFHRAAGKRTTVFGKGALLDEKQRRLLKSRKSNDVELRLLPERVIFTSLKIPAAGIDHLEQIVAHRLDRLTPWNQDKMFYGFASAAKAGSDGQMEVDFAATSKDIASRSIGRLEAFGLVASRLGHAGEPIGSALRIDLFRGSNDVSRKRRRRHISIALATIAATSVCLFAATEYLALSSADRLVTLDRTLDSARRALVNGSANSTDRQGALQLIDAKTPSAAQFVLIDQLARILPDNTVLEELDLQQNNIRLAGTSGEASALIGILEDAPGLADASFAAAVTRQPDGRDRFDITATRVSQATKAKP